jgi:hypothetical protein
MVNSMNNVIIFDKTADSDPSGVGIIILTPQAIKAGVDLAAHAREILPSGVAFEIVDKDSLPWDKPRELWEWE